MCHPQIVRNKRAVAAASHMTTIVDQTDVDHMISAHQVLAPDSRLGSDY